MELVTALLLHQSLRSNKLESVVVMRQEDAEVTHPARPPALTVVSSQILASSLKTPSFG